MDETALRKLLWNISKTSIGVSQAIAKPPEQIQLYSIVLVRKGHYVQGFVKETICCSEKVGPSTDLEFEF